MFAYIINYGPHVNLLSQQVGFWVLAFADLWTHFATLLHEIDSKSQINTDANWKPIFRPGEGFYNLEWSLFLYSMFHLNLSLLTEMLNHVCNRLMYVLK